MSTAAKQFSIPHIESVSSSEHPIRDAQTRPQSRDQNSYTGAIHEELSLKRKTTMHDLAQRNGKYQMFTVGDRDAAWHKLGQRTPNAVTWREAVKLADLDWSVVKKQLYARNPLGKVVDLPVYGTFRTDDGAFLGTVGDGYEIIQNIDQFTFVDAFLEAANGAHYESAGALGNGERIWTLARIPEADYTIDGGDEHKAYIMVANSHDGSLAYQMKLVDTRVVCWNTLQVAIRENGAAFKVRHTASAKARMDAALQVMKTVKLEAIGLKEKMQRLADVKLTRESVTSILDRLFPKPKDEKANQTRRDNTLADVLSLYEKNDANAFPSVKGTGYNLLNAVTEYTDHLRTARGNGSKPEQVAIARAESALFGSGDKLKSQALEVILEAATPASTNLSHIADATMARRAVN
jgi:phage/plasmid-like protein (TIGR03299 family)